MYNIISNKIKNLYILKVCVREILTAIYNDKYYFNRNRIMYDLRSLAINNKIYLIKKYVEYYLIY